ncbi:hypothetical protein J2S43_004829 [Catenuloplanes nepalensis]|uniref:Orc1-like AAA ATPase domain-containing protein n=1 Tax=Catenuloplanes nepalensis TaxID=587533 RepID=A0ABT9MY01_9ACTN|nr:AAA family ATPase [Catenuloplanes nepalensis]MDP9796317.1 hypothetical protein [Catenuloplanes nepalensis]
MTSSLPGFPPSPSSSGPAPEAAALNAIRDMWADRSPAERSAFAATLETPPPAADQDLQNQISRVRMRGALSGGVDPATLVTGLDPEDGQRVLDLLVPEFDRSHVDDVWRWTMRSGPRRDALRALADSPRALTDAITDAIGVPTDQAGQYLRLLAAHATGLAALPPDGLAARPTTLPARPATIPHQPGGTPPAAPAGPPAAVAPPAAPAGPPAQSAAPPAAPAGPPAAVASPVAPAGPPAQSAGRAGPPAPPAAPPAQSGGTPPASPGGLPPAAPPASSGDVAAAGSPSPSGVAAPGPDDGAGLAALDAARLLAAIAATGAPPPERPVGTRTALQALAWAEPLGGLAGDLAEARRRVRVEAVVESYGALLGNGFFGREEELSRLRDFATAPVTGDDTPVPLLPVVGLGGAGKSTALAAFVDPYLREILRPDSTGPVVIVIDFDRVQFRIDAELELSFEVSRQLGDAHPVAAADFSALRYQVRQERAGTAAARYSGSLAAGEGAGDAPAFERDASPAVRMHGLDARPVLLILDTFEEWQRDRPDPARPRLHDNDPEARILHWIARLKDTMGLHGLRVILSGRADVAIDAADVTRRVEVAEAICLADLAPEAAAELLTAHGVPADQAFDLAVLVGGNPLTLRVAARFFGHLPPGERAEFIAGTGSALDGELRREVLYARFLWHVADPRVRRLAHPGLILRRVTAGLIRHVLAPYCGLGPLTDAGAAELLERLADEVWLVKRDGDEVRHLPDVRRAMLHLMTTDPAYRDALPAIHRAAASWYHALPGEDAAVEALYHELMLRFDDDTSRRMSERGPARPQPPDHPGTFEGAPAGAADDPVRSPEPAPWSAPGQKAAAKPRRLPDWWPVWPPRQRTGDEPTPEPGQGAGPATGQDRDRPAGRDVGVVVGRDAFASADRPGPADVRGRTDPLDPADPRLAGRLAALGDAVDELPPATAAEARVLRGETPPLAEALRVSDRAWALWLERRGRFLVDNDAAAEALELLDARPAPAEPEWLAQACCDLARWDEYGPRASAFGGGRLTPHRYQTIAALLSGSVIALPAVDPETIGGGPGFHGHALTHYYYRLLLRQPADIAAWRRSEPLLAASAADLTGTDRNPIDLFPVDELRRALVWVAAGCPGGTIALQNPVPGIGTSLSRRRISESPEILRRLRGDNPELRAAVRTALLETDDPGPPHPESLVHIDVMGELGAYLDMAVARNPRVEPVHRVRAAVRRWDRINAAVIDAIVRDAAAGWPGL